MIGDMLSGLQLRPGGSRERGRTPAYSFMLKLSFLFRVKAKNPVIKTKFISPSPQLKCAQGGEDAHSLQMQLRFSQYTGPHGKVAAQSLVCLFCVTL